MSQSIWSQETVPMSGKRYFGGEMVVKRAGQFRPSKVQRYRKKAKIGLRGLLLRDKPEIKEFSYTSGLNNIVTGGQLYIVNQVAQGTNFVNRIGNHIRARALQVRYVVWPPASGTTSDDVRMIIVWDTQPNGAANAVIYSATGDTPNSILSNQVAPAIAFKNTGLAGDRFIILKDEMISVQNNAPLNTTLQQSNYDTKRYGKCYIPLKNQDMEFNTTTGGIPTTGALYVCWVSANNQGTSTQNAQFVFASKLTFTDV